MARPPALRLQYPEKRAQTMTAPGAFSAQITGPMTIGNTYYFRAIGVNADPGYVRTFYVP